MGIEQLGDTEVDKQRATRLALEHCVVRLDVAMHEPFGARMGRGLENPFRHGEGVVRGEYPALPQSVCRRLPIHERRDALDQAFAVARDMDRQDRRAL
jgi:hypothetical protein